MSEKPPDSPPERPRRRRKDTPWSRKRRRLLLIGGCLLLPLVPAVALRLGLAREARDLVVAAEARGIPVTAEALNARLPVFDTEAQENIAARYLAAARAYTPPPGGEPVSLPFFNGPTPAPPDTLDPVQRDILSAHVEANAAVIDDLLTINAVGPARYLDSYPLSRRDRLPHLGDLQPLVSLLCAASLLHAEAGEGDRAIAALDAAAGLARSLEHDGLHTGLQFQWSMERTIIDALEYVLWRTPPDPDRLEAFARQFSVAAREARLRQVLETELGLFVARIREGRSGGFGRRAVLSAGVGDVNLREALVAGEWLLAWPEADFEGRQALEAHYASRKKAWERRPLLHATLLRFGPPDEWALFRLGLDRAAVVEVVLAAFRYRHAHGRLPASPADLAPAYLPAIPRLASNDEEPIFEPIDGGITVCVPGPLDEPIQFFLRG